MRYNFLLLKKIKGNERGSFSVEASLVFPIIFLLIVFFIYVSIFIYQKVSLYYIASITADRAASNWNNSSKDPYTGEFPVGNDEDGLYWRLSDDNILDIFFKNQASIEKSYNLSMNQLDLSLPEKKLKKIASIIPKDFEGRLYYKNSIHERKVTVELTSPLQMPSFVSLFLGDRVHATASSTVTDPVEFIRNIDLIRTYSKTFLEHRKEINDWQKKQK